MDKFTPGSDIEYPEGTVWQIPLMEDRPLPSWITQTAPYRWEVDIEAYLATGQELPVELEKISQFKSFWTSPYATMPSGATINFKQPPPLPDIPTGWMAMDDQDGHRETFFGDLDKMAKYNRMFQGTFEIEDGKLNFVCRTHGVSFEDVRAGLIILRDEINRQLAEQENCPHYPQNPLA